MNFFGDLFGWLFWKNFFDDLFGELCRWTFWVNFFSELFVWPFVVTFWGEILGWTVLMNFFGELFWLTFLGDLSSCKNQVRQTGFFAFKNQFQNWFLQGEKPVHWAGIFNLIFQKSSTDPQGVCPTRDKSFGFYQITCYLTQIANLMFLRKRIYIF